MKPVEYLVVKFDFVYWRTINFSYLHIILIVAVVLKALSKTTPNIITELKNNNSFLFHESLGSFLIGYYS